MKNTFDPNMPIYLQVIEVIKKDIINQKYRSGAKIPSVRELALQYGVNPNTIQKSLSELERDGLLYSERAIGRYVTEDESSITKLKKEISYHMVQNFIKEMMELGFTKSEIITIIQKFKI
jgi:DNA-binding transcriptional regulator YhcF (GntR family)